MAVACSVLHCAGHCVSSIALIALTRAKMEDIPADDVASACIWHLHRHFYDGYEFPTNVVMYRMLTLLCICERLIHRHFAAVRLDPPAT